MKSQYATNLGKNFPVGRLAIGRTGHYAQDVPSSSLFSICECSLAVCSVFAAHPHIELLPHLFNIRGHPERTSEMKGGEGQPKWDKLRQGDGGSSQSGCPPSMIKMKGFFNMPISGLEFMPPVYALCGINPFHPIDQRCSNTKKLPKVSRNKAKIMLN